MTEVRKIAAYVSVSRQSLLDAGAIEPTEAERREMDAQRVETERLRRLATEAWPVMVQQLDAVTGTVGRAMLDLHSADERGECVGCDFDGYEAERPIWPCRTVTKIADLHGIEVHPNAYLAEQYHKFTGSTH